MSIINCSNYSCITIKSPVNFIVYTEIYCDNNRCRFYHIVPGGNYGWRSPQLGKFWRKPPYFIDCVPPVCYLGRGSPTGVACYRHTHFPEQFRGGFFLADWTFGRIATARAMRGLTIPMAEVKGLQANLMLAFARIGDDPDWAMQVAMQVLKSPMSGPTLKLRAVRLIQLAYGDLTKPGSAGTIWEGYTLRNPSKKVPSLDLILSVSSLLHTQHPDLDREVSRTLAALGGGKEMVTQFATRINAKSSVEDDIHFLAAIGLVEHEWSYKDTLHIVHWLLSLEEKVARDWVTRDQNWPLRLEEILEVLGRSNPAIAEKLVKHYAFGCPEHLLFVKPLGISRSAAAKKFHEAADNDPNYAWTPGIIRLLDSLPLTVTRPVLLKLWDRQQLRDTILKLLASDPEPRDQPKFLVGLASLDPEVVQSCARSLTKLSPSSGPTELVATLKALRKLAPEDKTTREAIASLLRKRSGEAFAPDPKLWTDWATKKYPGIVKLLATNDGFDPAAWKKREQVIPWDKGDAPRGRLVFTKATCASCHDGGRAMGPSLLGVAKRFSRDDLLTAILEPSKDVSPRYRPTRLSTLDDKVYVGMIVYEATDGIILQTNPDTVIRIAGDNVASKRTVDISLMPAGLLDKLTDTEVADLFVYLKSQDK